MYASNWNDLSTFGVAALKHMDRSRQARGQLLERAGYGPQETPCIVVHAEAGLKLRRYGDSGGPAVLLVPAPIKRAYIWDLAPAISVVQRWLEHGYRVYLAEWVPLDEGQDAAADSAGFGLAGYGDRLLTNSRRAIQQDCGQDQVVIAGHSLGGILAAIHACLHPEHIAATVLLESPLGFDPASDCFAPLVRATPDARRIADAFGQVPGSFLNMMSAAAEPHAFGWERLLDRTVSMSSPQALGSYMRVERWTHDEFPLPGPLFVDLVEALYRRDALSKGELVIGARSIGPHDLRTPLISVFDPRSKVIPPQSVQSFHEAAASADKLLLEYSGDIGVNLQHVGVLVGRNAHARLWPAIFNWLDALRDAASVAAAATETGVTVAGNTAAGKTAAESTGAESTAAQGASADGGAAATLAASGSADGKAAAATAASAPASPPL